MTSSFLGERERESEVDSWTGDRIERKKHKDTAFRISFHEIGTKWVMSDTSSGCERNEALSTR